MHDFKLYQDSVGSFVSESILFLGDSGYQGILKFHKNSLTPKKKPKGGELTVEEKLANRRISRLRVFVENVVAKFKNLYSVKNIKKIAMILVVFYGDDETWGIQQI